MTEDLEFGFVERHVSPEFTLVEHPIAPGILGAPTHTHSPEDGKKHPSDSRLFRGRAWVLGLEAFASYAASSAVPDRGRSEPALGRASRGGSHSRSAIRVGGPSPIQISPHN